MKTTLKADGNIAIPDEIRRSDRLTTGDSFHLERLMAGHYLLTKDSSRTPRFTVSKGEDGLPVIGPDGGTITSQMIKEIEGQIS